jgi:hypothetical protein
LTLQLSTPGGVVPLTATYSADQTGNAFDRRVLNVASETDSWTQYTEIAEIGTLGVFAIVNPSTNANAVNYALTGAATYQAAEIPVGGWALVYKPSGSQLYFSHLGGTGTTQDVEIFAIEV